MTVHDLDEARAARAEVADDPPAIRLGGVDYQLVAELPLEFADLVLAGRLRLAVGILLADIDELESFMAHKPTLGDLTEIAGVYGFRSLGESLASRTRSNGTSKPSRPTSKRTTGSTSARPAGGRPAKG